MTTEIKASLYTQVVVKDLSTGQSEKFGPEPYKPLEIPPLGVGPFGLKVYFQVDRPGQWMGLEVLSLPKGQGFRIKDLQGNFQPVPVGNRFTLTTEKNKHAYLKLKSS